jgi:hypothetical protein
MAVLDCNGVHSHSQDRSRVQPAIFSALDPSPVPSTMARRRRLDARARSFPNPLVLLSFVLSFSSYAFAATNRTIDDTIGDSVTGALPSYSPAGAWNVGQDCKTCYVRPADPSRAFNATWHDTTQDPVDVEQHTVTVTFVGASRECLLADKLLTGILYVVGTAVYVYCILDNRQLDGITTLTNLSVTLDGTVVGSFVHAPTDKDDLSGYLYNVPVYSNAVLRNKKHTLSVSTLAQQSSSLILFDYVVYTCVCLLDHNACF